MIWIGLTSRVETVFSLIVFPFNSKNSKYDFIYKEEKTEL